MSYYFDKNTDIKSNEVTTRTNIRNKIYTFKTDNNVFSKKGLDFGTRTLLENIDLNIIKGNVLDFGCGYGPIGIFISTNTNSNVDMIDINERALKLAKKNSMLNGAHVNIFSSDIYSNVSKKYDFIITNPPIRVGNKILHSILFGAREYLTDNGHLIFVVNKNQGAKTLAKKMEEFYEVKIIAKNKGFFVIDCQNQLTSC